MHAYRKLIEEQMTARDLSQADVARAAALTRQRVSQLLKDDRDRLPNPPDVATVEGLARAFKLAPEVVWTAVAEAMGLPRFVVPSITHEVKDVSNAQLLKELASRMGLEVTVRPTEPPAREGQKIDPQSGLPAVDGVPIELPEGATQPPSEESGT